MNKERFVELFNEIHSDFCMTKSLNSKTVIIIWWDKLSVHVSAAQDPRVKDLGLKIQFNNSIKNSKTI